MAADLKAKYGTSNQLITCSLAPAGVGLASGSARASTSVDNTTNVFLDALVQINIKTGAAGVVATGTVRIYAYGTADGAATFTEGATGTDAAITLVVPTNARLIGVINTVANATTYNSGPWSVAAAFGGVLPDHWGTIIENQSGGALDVTEANHKKVYQGVFAQSI